MTSSGPIVTAHEVSLIYRVPRVGASFAKERALQLLRRDATTQRRALQNVSFEVARGEAMGVIGHNGAGKTTLLRVLARQLRPSAGHVVVRGRHVPLLGLGAALTPDLTGAEVVVLLGALIGRDPRRMRTRVGPIAHWAGLDDDIHLPVRTYSTGMRARLAFAVATDEATDLLLVDETLSVGDQEFRRRSKDRLLDMHATGATVLLVSHQFDLLREAGVSRVLWLDGGRVRALGPAEDVLSAYEGERPQRRLAAAP